MRNWSLLLFTGLLTSGLLGAQTFKSPDILIETRLDYDWSDVLVKKFRLLLKNYQAPDPFTADIPGLIVLNESRVGDLLPEDSRAMLKDFGNAVGLNFIKAETKVWIENLSYDVKGFKTNLRGSEVNPDGVMLSTEFSASEISLSAEKLSLNLVIPGKNNSPIFNVHIIKPSIRGADEKLINFLVNLKVLPLSNKYKLQILKANFEKMASRLLSNPEDLSLDFERIIIPKVSLKVGNKTINFSPAKIEQYIRSKQSAIKGILLAQTASALRSNTAAAAMKVVEKYEFEKEFWIEGDFLTNQNIISKVSTSPAGDKIEVTFNGDACPNQKFKELKFQCLPKRISAPAVSRLNEELHERSMYEMKSLMDRENADIVVSVSEDYINKILVASYDAGLWEEGLKEADVALGPNKSFMRLDKTGESGTLVLDVIYKPKKIEKFLTGSREIRFPLVLDIGMRIDVREDGPHVVFKVLDVDTSDQTLIQGRPHEGMPSSVKDVKRFKGKVAKAIRKKLAVLKGKDMIELPYPEYKGLGIETIEFLSDGNGRMNAFTNAETFKGN